LLFDTITNLVKSHHIVTKRKNINRFKQTNKQNCCYNTKKRKKPLLFIINISIFAQNNTYYGKN